MKEMNIPVGVSDFEEIRKNGYYYIDKSGLIRELLNRRGTEVTWITRPRRFGKTLGMSMLESFFDIRKDSRALFEGLEISENRALCDEWMNQYPTVFVSFRQVDGLDFAGAYDMLTWVISELYKEHRYLLDSDRICTSDKEIAKQLEWGQASMKDMKGSLMLLTRMMQQHYEKPVILLIDEYDVPVAKANNNGYYNEMLDVMNSNEDLDCVTAYQDERKESKLMTSLKSMFYKIINGIAEVRFVNGASDFRLMKRAMVDAILEMTEYHRFSKGIFSWVGFNTEYIPYTVEERESGESKWGFRKLLKYAFEGIVSFTTFPLKLSAYVGFLSSIVSIIYLIVV